MINKWKVILMGLMAAMVVAGTAPRAHAVAITGDVNNSGAFDASDCLVLLQCLNGSCPAAPAGGFCGTGNILDCGNLFADNPGPAALTGADVSVCNDAANHVPTLYDPGHGPGNPITCNTPDPVHGGFRVELGSQTITTSQTWPASCHVYIEGTVFVGVPPGPNPVTPVIRIEKGSVIHARTSGGGDPAALIFLPGTHIDAQGTPAQPIIMTSGDVTGAPVPGSRAPGDWAGLEFLGKSTVNRPGCSGTAEGIPLSFGGCITNDTSGIMTFTRVEFGGQIFTPNNELNDITFNGIGSGTQFNFLAAVAGDDDTFEWFGSNSSHHHFFSMASADDNFDTQLGSTVTLQYGVAIQNPATMQVGRDCRGIESDNSEFDFEALPRDFPQECNLTMVGGNKMPGAAPGLGANDGSDSGVLIRRGGDYQLANVIVQDFNDSGFEIRDVSTATQACNAGPTLTGKLVVKSSVFYDNGTSNVSGAATEQPKDNDGTLDTTPGCDLNPCAAAGCNCDSESLYNLFVTDPSFPVVNPCGSNAVNTGISDQYPPLDNTACTGLETPFVCCAGAGTGSCRALPNVIPNPTGDPFPPAFNCKNFNPILDTTTYIGAVNPAAGPSCVFTGANAHCDWLSKPWLESAIN